MINASGFLMDDPVKEIEYRYNFQNRYKSCIFKGPDDGYYFGYFGVLSDGKHEVHDLFPNIHDQEKGPFKTIKEAAHANLSGLIAYLDGTTLQSNKEWLKQLQAIHKSYLDSIDLQLPLFVEAPSCP